MYMHTEESVTGLKFDQDWVAKVAVDQPESTRLYSLIHVYHKKLLKGKECIYYYLLRNH